MSIIQKAIAALKEAWATEPLRVLTIVAGVVTFACAKFGVVVDQHSVLEALAFLTPLLVATGVGRQQVVPKAKLLRRSTDRPPSREVGTHVKLEGGKIEGGGKP
jgi:hypothetical protein